MTKRKLPLPDEVNEFKEEGPASKVSKATFAYLTEAEIINVNKLMVNESTDPKDEYAIIKISNLKIAVDNPQNIYITTIAEIAFAYVREIGTGHSFFSANKRTATECLKQFMNKNGYTVNDNKLLEDLVNKVVGYTSDDDFKLKAHFINDLSAIALPLIIVGADYLEPDALTPPVSPANYLVEPYDPLSPQTAIQGFSEEFNNKALAGDLTFDDLMD